jgi:hypothetical protein
VSTFFIGKASHWIALVVVVGLLVVAGMLKLHVTNFILLVGLLITVSLILVLVVTLTFDENVQITREAIEEVD